MSFNRKILVNSSFILILNLILCLNIFSSGISSTFTEVLIENLQPGKIYSLKEIANYPYKLKNNSSRTENIKVVFDKVPSNYLKKDYENVPDLKWLKIKPAKYKVAPGVEKESDIIISIPDNEKYLGGKYQVDITAQTYKEGSSGFVVNLAIVSSLYFTVAKTRIETIQEEISKFKANMNFKINPGRIKFNCKNFNKPCFDFFELINLSNDICDYKLEVSNVGSSAHILNKNFKDTGLSFIKIVPSKLTLDGGEKEKIKLIIEYPKEKSFSTNLSFFIKTSVLSGENVKGLAYNKVLVNFIE